VTHIIDYTYGYELHTHTVKTAAFPGAPTAYGYMWGRDMYGTCPDTQAAACPDVPVEVRLSFFPDPSPFLNATAVPKAPDYATSKTGDVASGLVYVDVNVKTAGKDEDGSETFAAKPAPSNEMPGMYIIIPFNRPVKPLSETETMSVQCLRSVKGRLLPLDQFEAPTYPEGEYEQPIWNVASYYNSTMWAPYGAMACLTRSPGAYVLATYPAVPAVAPPHCCPAECHSCSSQLGIHLPSRLQHPGRKCYCPGHLQGLGGAECGQCHGAAWCVHQHDRRAQGVCDC
jgi:hypothetical protein